MREGPVSIETVADPATLPADALALFGQDAFSTLGWYRTTLAAALAPGVQACFHVARRGGVVLGVFPMQRAAGGFSALATPYTCLWQPLLAPGLDAPTLVQIGRNLGRLWRAGAPARLEALDAGAFWLAPLLQGLRSAGLRALRFDHFGNWFLPVAGLTWPDYLAGRPGALRSAIGRKTRRLMNLGAALTLTSSAEGVSSAIGAYEKIYARSWKEPESFPEFNAALMRSCAAEGTLRLGVLALDGEPIAAQVWVVHAGWAGVLKLAHDEAYRALAPGTVLSGLIIRHLLERDRVTELDFGRGDDGYKRLWTGQRRQRSGVLLADPWRLGGGLVIARHCAGKIRKAVIPSG